MPKITRQKLKLNDRDYRSDPVGAFAKLRETGPLFPARLFGFGNIWLATTYQACDEILKNDVLFCRNPRNAGKRNYFVFQLLLPGIFQKLSNNMLAMDEPDHRRLRTLVDQAFQRRSVGEMTPSISRIIDDHLNKLPDLIDPVSGQVDLVEHLARPIPLAVICEILGLPESDRPKFKEWFAGFSNIRSLFGILKVMPGLRKTIRYLQQQFESVKKQPRPGLISALVEVEQGGDRLSDKELISMVMLLLLAGHETTVHLISTSILTLLAHPNVTADLMADSNRAPPIVEEMLRYNSPAQFSKPRFVTKDTQFHGINLHRGESVMPAIASANLDPLRFESPERFDWQRPDNHHLGFGTGPHVCLGMKLARVETETVLLKLFEKFPNVSAGFDLKSPDWSTRLGFRALASLKVHLGHG